MNRTLTTICLLLTYTLGYSQTSSFDLLNANPGSNKSIIWFTSDYGSGFGHKIYNIDPGGKTDLRIAARHNSASWTDAMTFTSQGKIGIGLINPVALFQLNSLSTNSTDNGLRFSASNIGPNHSHIFWGLTGDWYVRSASNSGKVIIQDQGGNVGIGTTNPTEKLVVDGKIIAEEVKVQNVPASDYVFEPDYNLLSLHEVESFIKENKHLPDIPSAAEFKESGVGLGEMDNMLLRKVEELTLYMIELQKKYDDLLVNYESIINKLESN
jgi:hypothetical protein